MTRPLPRFSARVRPKPFVSTLIACAVGAFATSAVRVSNAAPPPDAPVAVDVRLNEASAPHRIATIEWNPLSLFIDRFSLNVVIVPGDHHALVVSPFYTWAGTTEFSTGVDSEGRQLTDTTGGIVGTPGSPYVLSVPRQTFKGFGGEIGYRYYADRGGPRGFFAGPSLILDAITATAYNGSQTSFAGYGLALDAGYEALIADTIAVSVGAGAQYTFTSKEIPPQQLPASIYANQRLYPRMLLSFGYAF